VKLLETAVNIPPLLTVKLAEFTILSYPVPTFKALKELLATGLTFGRLMAFRMLALAFELVDPVGVIEMPLTLVEVDELLVLVKVRLARFDPVPLNELSEMLNILPDVAALVKVCPAKVGVAVVLMFCIVFTIPEPLSEKLVELKAATPLVDPSALALAIEITPVAEMERGPLAETTTVPELSGRVMVLAAVGEVKASVNWLVPPVLVPNTKLVPM